VFGGKCADLRAEVGGSNARFIVEYLGKGYQVAAKDLARECARKIYFPFGAMMVKKLRQLQTARCWPASWTTAAS
jgi:chemotaxis receptor (MCP) glutamine deamidase CheD